MNIYAVYDKTAETFGTPFFQHTDQLALRAFKMEVNRPNEQNVIYLNPEDFSLSRLGSYSTKTGELIAKVEKLSEASALVSPVTQK